MKFPIMLFFAVAISSIPMLVLSPFNPPDMILFLMVFFELNKTSMLEVMIFSMMLLFDLDPKVEVTIVTVPIALAVRGGGLSGIPRIQTPPLRRSLPLGAGMTPRRSSSTTLPAPWSRMHHPARSPSRRSRRWTRLQRGSARSWRTRSLA